VISSQRNILNRSWINQGKMMRTKITIAKLSGPKIYKRNPNIEMAAIIKPAKERILSQDSFIET
jgi:hypothetical protein